MNPDDIISKKRDAASKAELELPRCCATCSDMDNNTFLPKCPKCSAWPMSASEVDDSFHTRIKFVCSKCATVSNKVIRRALAQRQTENSVS